MRTQPDIGSFQEPVNDVGEELAVGQWGEGRFPACVEVETASGTTDALERYLGAWVSWNLEGLVVRRAWLSRWF